MPEIRINVTDATRDYAAWALKRDATTALKALQARGLNTEDCVRIHPAHNRFFRFYVIARPDPLSEFTWLMRDDGTWTRGRLYDGYDEARWVPMPTPEPIPATFTHITRTAPYHDRQERWRSKSNGSCGRWVWADDSVALCVCGWSTHTSTRSEAQAAARWHRTNPTPASYAT